MQRIRVMGFNIFSPGELEPGEILPPEEEFNSWEDRASLPLRTIARYHPDLIGFQEMESAKLATYRTALPEYEAVEPGHPEELPTIFWHRDRLELVEGGVFWAAPASVGALSGWVAAFLSIAPLRP